MLDIENGIEIVDENKEANIIRDFDPVIADKKIRDDIKDLIILLFCLTNIPFGFYVIPEFISMYVYIYFWTALSLYQINTLVPKIIGLIGLNFNISFMIDLYIWRVILSEDFYEINRLFFNIRPKMYKSLIGSLVEIGDINKCKYIIQHGNFRRSEKHEILQLAISNNRIDLAKFILIKLIEERNLSQIEKETIFVYLERSKNSILIEHCIKLIDCDNIISLEEFALKILRDDDRLDILKVYFPYIAPLYTINNVCRYCTGGGDIVLKKMDFILSRLNTTYDLPRLIRWANFNRCSKSIEILLNNYNGPISNEEFNLCTRFYYSGRYKNVVLFNKKIIESRFPIFTKWKREKINYLVEKFARELYGRTILNPYNSYGREKIKKIYNDMISRGDKYYMKF